MGTTTSLDRKKLKDYPDILSVNDISIILDVNPKTVYKRVSEGEIKSFKVGRLYKITKRNLVKYLNASLQ